MTLINFNSKVNFLSDLRFEPVVVNKGILVGFDPKI